MKDKKKWIIGISICVLLIVSVFFMFHQGKILSFERCPFHTETPDHYALVSYLIDL